jgi:hypothetical protein
MFWDWNHVGDSCRIAVDCRRGGEDDVVDIVLLHTAEESDGSAYIHTVVFKRLLARFTDCLEEASACGGEGGLRQSTYLQCSEVDDAVDVWMCCKHLVQRFFICDIDFVELWPLSAEQLNAVKRDLGGIVQTINDHDFVAMFEECKTGE